MNFLKDKKNLPIVIALAVVLLIGSGGLVAWETGLFNSTPAPVISSTPTGGPPGTPLPSGMAPPSGMLPPGGMPQRGPTGPPLGMPRGVAGVPAAVPAVAKKPDTVDPAIGPDPFKIPNGTKIASQIANRLLPPKPTLRDRIGPLNLFQIHPPTPSPVLITDSTTTSQQNGTDPTSRYRLSGIINGPDGINAIMEVDGQSQSLKPGDTLSDGTRITNIQATSVTLRTTGGAALNLQLSAGTPDQGTPNYNGQGSFQPGFPQQGQN